MGLQGYRKFRLHVWWWWGLGILDPWLCLPFPYHPSLPFWGAAKVPWKEAVLSLGSKLGWDILRGAPRGGQGSWVVFTTWGVKYSRACTAPQRKAPRTRAEELVSPQGCVVHSGKALQQLAHRSSVTTRVQEQLSVIPRPVSSLLL